MDKKMKIALACLMLLTLMTVAVAISIWQWQTQITVMEPFEVNTNLPTTATLYPDTYSYYINVTNHARQDLNATLYWTYTAVNVTVTISPDNGTSITIPSGETGKFDITIEIKIGDYPANGTATIDWSIDRTSP